MNSNETFSEHFEKKFENLKIKIINQDFPLLEVKQIGKQLNFLSVKTQKGELEQPKKETITHVHPDLVVFFPIPASFYVQAMFLPSVFQRINRLLLSREIRLSVASYFSWESAMQNSKFSRKRTFLSTSNGVDAQHSPKRRCTRELKNLRLTTPIEARSNPDLRASIQIEYIHPDEVPLELLTSLRDSRKGSSDKRDPTSVYVEKHGSKITLKSSHQLEILYI